MTILLGKVPISKYHNSILKRLLDIFLASVIIILSLPPAIIIALISLAVSPGEIFFVQKRTGQNGKTFKIIKFRTMVKGAEKLQKKYIKLNESDGPVFKIKNDPRFTVFGKILSNTGLDELPQFINVLKGEMSIVGPRPLPIYESRRLPKKYKVRELVKPGITSSWVTGGSHRLPFTKWMKLDSEYVLNGTLSVDLRIMLDTMTLMLRYISRAT